MDIAEPTTAFTDLLLAIAGVVFGIRTTHAWRYAFLFTGIGALTGGIYHSVHLAALWKATVLAIGIANFFLIVAVSAARLSQRMARLMMWIAGAQLVAYVIWTGIHDAFVYVIVDYGTGMIFAAIVYAVPFTIASKYVLASVALTVIGAYVQAAHISLSPNFNHNDLYHVIQLVSLFLLYRGARASAMSASTASVST